MNPQLDRRGLFVSALYSLPTSNVRILPLESISHLLHGRGCEIAMAIGPVSFIRSIESMKG